MRRPPEEVLARARALSLISIVEDGMYTEMIPGFVDELGLAPWLTERERLWFDGSEPLDVIDGYQIEAMLVLAWSIGLIATLGDRDPEAYGDPLCLLQDLRGIGEPSAEELVAPRPEDDLRAMLTELDALAEGGEAAPPDERFGYPALGWRRAALRWLLEPAMPWPSDPVGGRKS